MNSIIEANLIGMLLYPAVWAQFKIAKGKRQFLYANLVSCLIFAASFAVMGKYALASVSLAAGVSSLGQALFENKPPVIRYGLSVLAITAAIAVNYPVDIMGWLAAGAYIMVRFAESQKEEILRIAYLISPVIWMVIALSVHNFALVPVELLAIILASKWMLDRLEYFNSPDPSVH